MERAGWHVAVGPLYWQAGTERSANRTFEKARFPQATAGGKVTERQLRATVLIGSGLLLIVGAEPITKWFAGAPPLEMGLLNLLSPLGLIVLIIGIYRASTKGKQL